MTRTTINLHFNPATANSKTGTMPVVTAPRKTCPPECPLFDLNFCYAKHSFMGIHWRKVSSGERGESFADVMAKISKLRRDTIWRYGVAGDLPGENGYLDKELCESITSANGRSAGYAYTHYRPGKGDNLAILQGMNKTHFTVNLSSDTLAEADEFIKTGLPGVTLLPEGAPKGSHTPAGNKVVRCPAKVGKVTCADCRLCTRKDRDYVIGFEAHGTGRKAISKL